MASPAPKRGQPVDIGGLENLLIEQFKLTQLLANFEATAEPVLAGGAVRDYLLGRPLKDLDIATRNDPTPAARAFARRMHGHWFWLDRSRLQSRVLLGSGAEQLSYDFTPWRAPRLDDDLRQRDFTVNALALPLIGAGRRRLLDPLQGLTHLRRRELRLCSEHSLKDDPLRVLRGIRLMAQLRLTVPQETLAALVDAAGLLHRTAGERIAEELRLLFAAAPQENALELLRQTRVFELLAGITLQRENPRQAALCFQAWDRQLAALESEVPSWAISFRQEEPGNQQLLGSLKFALLMVVAETSQPQRAALLRRLKLGRRATGLINRLFQLLVCGEPWVDTWPRQTRARLRRIEELQPNIEPVLLALWLVNQRDPQELALVDELLALYREHFTTGQLPDLVSGAELIERLGLEPGRAVGDWQAKLRKMEYSGAIENRQQAIDFLHLARRQRD